MTFHVLEEWSWVDSFYVVTMTISGAGAEGKMPNTATGKVIIGTLSLFSVGVVVGVIVYIFSPIVKKI